MNAWIRGFLPGLWSGVLVCLLAAGAGAATPTGAGACDTNRGLLPAGKPLARMAHSLGPGQRLDILAVGSATMLAPRLGLAASFPARTVQMLREARPGADIRLVTRAERGASAVELLGILRHEMAAHHASLILWQTGTAETARGRPAAEFQATLAEGVRVALAAGSDIVLIDPPFSRLLTSRGDPAQYDVAYREAAAPAGAAVFSRYGLTRHWVDSGQLDLERTAAPDRPAAVARLHECLARALSHGLLAAADASSAATAAR